MAKTMAEMDPKEFLRIGKLVQSTKFNGDGRDYVVIVGYISEQEQDEVDKILADLDTYHVDRCIQLSIIRKFGFYSEYFRDGKPYLPSGRGHLTSAERYKIVEARIKKSRETEE